LLLEVHVVHHDVRVEQSVEASALSASSAQNARVERARSVGTARRRIGRSDAPNFSQRIRPVMNVPHQQPKLTTSWRWRTRDVVAGRGSRFMRTATWDRSASRTTHGGQHSNRAGGGDSDGWPVVETARIAGRDSRL